MEDLERLEVERKEMVIISQWCKEQIRALIA